MAKYIENIREKKLTVRAFDKKLDKEEKKPYCACRMTKFFSTALIIFLLLFSGTECKKGNPIVPPDGVDTTSQDFSITTLQYGNGYASAYAEDSWVFGESNIWVVGMFPDTVGFDDRNILRWDGNKWAGFGALYNSSGFGNIYALDSSTIFFVSTGGIVREYKNGNIVTIQMDNIAFSSADKLGRLWASSEKNIWCVGAHGIIVHYDGSEWKKIPFDSNYTFTSMTGSKQTGVAYASAWGQQGVRLIQLTNDSATVLSVQTDPQTAAVQSLLLYDEKTLWVGGSALRSYSLENNTYQFLRNSDGVFVNATSMASPNDIYFLCEKNAVGGWVPLFMHYNGARFTVYDLPRYSFSLNHGISAVSGLAVIAAEADNKALIITIRRK